MSKNETTNNDKTPMFGAPILRQLNFFTQPLVVMVETFRMSVSVFVEQTRLHMVC